MGESGNKSHPVRRLYWANARNDIEDKQVEEQIQRFCSFMKDRFQYDIRPDSDNEILHRAIAEPMELEEFGCLDLEPPPQKPLPFVVAILPKYHSLAKSCMENNPDALYGGNRGCECFVYGPTSTLNHSLLHEMLHLVGADDCYDSEDHWQTCTFPNCIMQYNPCNAVYEKPHLRDILCKTNIDRIEGWVKSARGS